LYTAKKKVEQRIVVLGGEDDSVRSSKCSKCSSLTDPPQKPIQSETPTTNRLSLRDVLTTPTSLSYFMEFMDRRNRSLLVQFWLTVESFKNPLEAVDSDSSGDDDDELIQHSETVKEDITMVNDLYFSSPTPHPALSVISAKHINAIRVFALDESTPNPSAERKVKRNVMLAQRQVERDMEGDFEDFQRSPLWFRVVGDTESNNAMTASVMSSSVISDSGPSPFNTVRGRDSQTPVFEPLEPTDLQS
jgi:sorting nexin-25